MFKKETVFILGAGASVPYGYPTGKVLIDKIIQSVGDEIYLPAPCTCRIHGNNNHNLECYNIDNLTKEDINSFSDDSIFSIPPSPNAYKFSNSKHSYIKTKIEAVREFLNLKEALRKLDPLSIDMFLRDNPSHQIAGKTMIQYVLLGCENKEKFGMTYEKDGTKCDNWYRLLLNDLLSACADNPESIQDNKLSVITFNYDLSLDIYLKEKLSSIELYQNNIGTNYWQQLMARGFKHVYGSLYDPAKENDWSYGDFFATTSTSAALNGRKFVVSFQNHKSIRLMQERNQPEHDNHYDEIKKLVNQAEEIIIIGFSFDRDNLDKLGLPKSKDDWINDNKTIRYLDYHGEMGGLNEQFNHLKSTTSKSITRSTATMIEHAYLNDFRIFLY